METQKLQRTKKIAFVFVIIAVMIGPPGWFLYREIRHEQLNRMLIRSILAMKYDDGLALVKLGADGTARDDPNLDVSFGSALRRLLSRLVHRAPVAINNGISDNAVSIMYDPGNMRGWSNYPPKSPSFVRLEVSLLNSGSPTEGTTRMGYSLLYWATLYENHDVLKALLRANPKLITSAGNALREADVEDTATLLANGVDIESADQSGRTAVFDAPADKLEFLISHGAKINIKSSNGETPLMSECNSNVDSLEVLLRHGANIHVRDNDGNTAILKAAQECPLETIKKLVSLGANIHDRNALGDTALMFAARSSDMSVMPWMLTQGIGVNLRGAGGNTALTIVTQHFADNEQWAERTRPIAQLLRQHGAVSVVPKARWDSDESKAY
jgi:hypothetical protein